MDEPLANLDLRSGQEIVELVSRVAKEQGVAVLLSAHDINPLLPVMDKVVYLAEGRAACGTTEQVVRSDVLSGLYRHPISVLRVDGRILVVAGSTVTADRSPGWGSDGNAVLHAVFEPGFWGSQPVRDALLTGAVVALVSGAVGVFTVLRGQSFAGHSLADLGTLGGSGAFLLGIGPLWGFVGAGVAVGGAMDLSGSERRSARDVSTGIVLGAVLGVSALLLYFDTTSGSTTGVTVTVLFGSLFAVTGARSRPPSPSPPWAWPRWSCSTGRCCSAPSGPSSPRRAVSGFDCSASSS
jgi:hypothetical protein